MLRKRRTRKEEVAMRTGRRFHLIVALLIAVAMLLGISQLDAHAVHGNYCGGNPSGQPGRSLNLAAWCQALYGQQASAAFVGQDAYGWACKIPGQPNKGIDMKKVCRKQYGDSALATLVGFGANDWRCLLPADVDRKVVPVLLLPVGYAKASEISSVADALRRLTILTSGVVHFYYSKAYISPKWLNGTAAFILPTGTSVTGWTSLMYAADWFQSDFHKRVLQELANGGWNTLRSKSTMRIAAFVHGGTPSSSQPPVVKPPLKPLSKLLEPLSKFAPSTAWALGRSGMSAPPPLPDVFSVPLFGSNSVENVSCDSTTGTTSPAYESVFYFAGNRLGTTLGLPRTDQYPFLAEALWVPGNLPQSIMMGGGYGTKSLLFPWEMGHLYNTWSQW
jgi:hypothetical protein